MLAIIAILVFVVVALGVFAVASLLDQRSAQARLLRERLATVQEAATRQPSEELALLRDDARISRRKYTDGECHQFVDGC